MFTPSDVEALAKLLAPPKEDSNEAYSTSNPFESCHHESPVPTPSHHVLNTQCEPIAQSEKNFCAVITSTRSIQDQEDENVVQEKKEKAVSGERVGTHLREP
eukprot:195692_1